jgi:hypothetical protein
MILVLSDSWAKLDLGHMVENEETQSMEEKESYKTIQDMHISVKNERRQLLKGLFQQMCTLIKLERFTLGVFSKFKSFW